MAIASVFALESDYCRIERSADTVVTEQAK